MSDHQEFQSEDEPTETTNEISENATGHSVNGLPPIVTVSQLPNPPAPQSPIKKKHDWRKDVTLAIEFLGLVALIVYTIFSILQWAQIRWTNRLTREALNGSDSSLKQTLGRLEWQIRETHEIAKQTQTQAQQTKTLAEESIIQANSAKVAATAAKSSANTANAALHISERAYLVAQTPELNWESETITFPIANVGHMPSGELRVVVHALTKTLPGEQIIYSWMPVKAYPITASAPWGLSYTIKGLDVSKIEAAQQDIFFAGIITYNDGFPDDTIQKLSFCGHVAWHIASKKVHIFPCDGDEMIPKMKKLGGYPDHQDHTNY